MANRNRPIQVKFRVTPEERALIGKRMEQAGISNMAAYLRKMAIDGYVVKLELPELRDLISLLRRTSNNFNQIARRVNATGRVYADDLHEMKTMLEQIWAADNQILNKLAGMAILRSLSGLLSRGRKCIGRRSGEWCGTPIVRSLS